MVVYIALILIGGILLLSNLDVNIGIGIKKVWPLLLIIAGGVGYINTLLKKKTRDDLFYLSLIACGIIFFLYYQYSLTFWKSWPIILIIIGVRGVVYNLVARGLTE